MNTKVIFANRDFDSAINEAARVIQGGDIVVLPTETVYGLCANALDETAVQKIFDAKGRPQDNPLIVHIADMDMLDRVTAGVPAQAKKLMKAYWPGPLSIVLQKNPAIPDTVSAGLSTVAVRMPQNEIMREVIRRAGAPLAAPSANRSGLPSPTTAQHAFEDLCGRVPLIVDGGPCNVGVESTVVEMAGDVPIILRPGGISPDMIQKVCGDVQVHPSVLDRLKEPEKVASPGMKYRHYAPRAQVYVFEGDKKTVAKDVNTRYHYYNEKPQKPVIFCTEDCAGFYAGKNVRTLGNTAAGAEKTLFAELRAADGAGIGVILFHYMDTMGLAVKNRILRAAEKTPQEVTEN